MEFNPRETYFTDEGEIICVTRVVERVQPHGQTRPRIYAVYCTGPKSEATFGDGELRDLEYAFLPHQLRDSYPRSAGSINTNLNAAFAEAKHGGHVAHCTTTEIDPLNAKGDRTIAVRPLQQGQFMLSVSSHKLGIRKDIGPFTEKQARHVARLFLYGLPLRAHVAPSGETYYEGFDSFINQGDRWCEVVEGTETPTRVRIEYEMPNTGTHGAWRKQTRVGDWLFIEN